MACRVTGSPRLGVSTGASVVAAVTPASTAAAPLFRALRRTGGPAGPGAAPGPAQARGRYVEEFGGGVINDFAFTFLIGILVGTYLSEYARQSALGNAVRFVSDVLLSAPSILIGLFNLHLWATAG